ncbi:choice-of-anchor M domain-containing protein [Streptomyces sp. RFCAC02]|uniref:choice-of-anchor M domain-containing protein n=1 Tax=Streptomyces sp. RFCAC02 TaxID=2499143 RepID=UPI0010204A4E|nr:choice-of-anchor M domain-containing protein [Streptomyces sp. RFCAC02]
MHHSVRRRRIGRTTLAAGLIGALAAITPTTQAAAHDPAEGRELLGAGVHVDAVYPEIEDGRLDVRTLTPDGVVDPDDVALHIPDTETSHVTLPEGYDFLGPEGTEAWTSTEVQDPSVVWPGWSFEGIGQGVLQGTVKVSYAGFSYAGEADEPRFAVTQPGGFDGSKVSRLFVPGSTFTSVTGEAGSHTHATWTFTEQGTYDIDFTVDVTLADGTPLSDDTTVRFIVGEPAETATAPVRQTDPEPADTVEGLTLVPDKVDAEYFVGQTVNLTALSPDAAETDTYRWYTVDPETGEASPDDSQDAPVFTTKPVRDLDGTAVYAERIAADGTVAETSDPVTLRVRALPPTTALTVTPDRDTYEAGDTAHFTSAQNPPTDDEHYHWYLRPAGEESYEWIPESRLADQDLEITPELDGAMITARLFDAGHAVLAESPPIRISVPGGDAAPAATVEVRAERDDYAVGDTASFTAETSEPGAEIEWSVRKSGENGFTVLDGADGTTLDQVVDAGWNGAEVRAVVRGDGGEAIAESSAAALAVSEETGTADAETDGDAADDASGGTRMALITVGLLVIFAVIAVFVLRSRRNRSAD